MSWVDDQVSFSDDADAYGFVETTDPRLIKTMGEKGSKYSINFLFRKAVDWAGQVGEMVQNAPERFGLFPEHVNLLNDVLVSVEIPKIPEYDPDSGALILPSILRGPVRYIPHVVFQGISEGIPENIFENTSLLSLEVDWHELEHVVRPTYVANASEYLKVRGYPLPHRQS